MKPAYAWLAVVLVGGLAVYSRADGVPFDEAGWRSDADADIAGETLRLRMSDDLAENVLRVGMTKEQVLELLGEPDQPMRTDDDSLVYYLGQDGYVVRSFHALVLDFADGKLAKIRIDRD